MPKGGSFDKASCMDCLILYALRSKTPLSFGYLMMRQMNESAHRHKGGFIPYALFLTKFFEYFDVDLENEASEDVTASLKGRVRKVHDKKKMDQKLIWERESYSCKEF